MTTTDIKPVTGHMRITTPIAKGAADEHSRYAIAGALITPADGGHVYATVTGGHTVRLPAVGN